MKIELRRASIKRCTESVSMEKKAVGMLKAQILIRDILVFLSVL